MFRSPRLKRKIQVAENEERDSQISGTMPIMSISQSRAPKDSRTTTIITGMKMGAHYYEFCRRITKLTMGCNAIWVIVDRLIKSVHFLLVNSTYSLSK